MCAEWAEGGEEMCAEERDDDCEDDEDIVEGCTCTECAERGEAEETADGVAVVAALLLDGTVSLMENVDMKV